MDNNRRQGIDSINREFNSGKYASDITAHWIQEKQDAIFSEYPDDIFPPLLQVLENNYPQGLFHHQVESWNETRTGRNVVISTGTSSGKSLCFYLPIVSEILKNPKATALLLFPTKALTNDQQIKINLLLNQVNQQITSQELLNAAEAYDGDTPESKRITIRNSTSLLLSNPDMLHVGILPHHTRWKSFLGNLKFIVIDEVHTYRGVFGSHFANVIRRLKRVLNFYGAFPQFILTSATISNPEVFIKSLIGEEFVLIDNDSSPKEERHYFFLNPPLVDGELGLRRGMLDQSVEIAELLLQNNVQSIFFSRTRKTVELTIKRMFSNPGNTDFDLIHGYRSGYLRQKRRDIENNLRDGIIRTVISTNALEMGIDMGKVDAIVMMGYAGTIASFFQQSGRAGRRNQTSAAILIASASPLDQFIIRHPEFLREGNLESALIDPDNPLILINHLKSASFELPFREYDSFGSLAWKNLQPYLDVLCTLSVLVKRKGNYYWAADSYPASDISLRNINNNPIVLKLTAENKTSIIGEIDFQSAYRFVHPGAVYLQDGNSFLVNHLYEAESYAELIPLDEDYLTEPRINSSIKVDSVKKHQKAENFDSFFGELRIIEKFTGFKKIDWKTNMLLGYEELVLPEKELLTKGVWLTISPDVVEILREANHWNNDSNDYGKKWLEIRKAIIARDSSQCRVCGNQFKSSDLHIHHKVPFRSFANPETANELNNLVTLCPACHKRVEQNIQIRGGLTGVSYLIASIAPLFLMCDFRDISYFSDPEADFCEKKPAIAIYDRFPGGIGLSAKIFEKLDTIINRCIEVIRDCPCNQGCPSCVGPSGENAVGGKKDALQILKKLI